MTFMLKRLTGLNRHNGELLDDNSHIHQAIDDILQTPIGSRVMRREYGSFLHELLDRPLCDALILQMYTAIVIAVLRWEPRIRPLSLAADISPSGTIVFSVHYERVNSNSKQRSTYSLEVSRR